MAPAAVLAADAEAPRKAERPAAAPTADNSLGDDAAPVFVPRAGTRPGQVRRPRWLFVSLAFDKYDPQVDSEPGLGGATPYAKVFQGRVPWRVQGEVAFPVWHHGLLGTGLLGASVGFWQNIGRGYYAAGPKAGERSGDTALLNIWPLGLRATWRLDQVADRWRWLPIIPYAQGGLMAAGWAAYNGAGDVSKARAPDTGRGAGWTTGWTGALGLALALDAIDPIISAEAYVNVGLQRTSLFAEYSWSKLDSFGGADALILTDQGWRAGLSLEF